MGRNFAMFRSSDRLMLADVAYAAALYALATGICVACVYLS
jgi:hypothetical protein